MYLLQLCVKTSLLFCCYERILLSVLIAKAVDDSFPSHFSSATIFLMQKQDMVVWEMYISDY